MDRENTYLGLNASRRVPGPAGWLQLYDLGDPNADQTVLFIHGFPDSAHTWARLTPHLSGYRLVAMNLRGVGLSSGPAAIAGYHTHALLDDLKSVLDQLGPGPVHLVGHDFGGHLAWQFAMHHPGKLASVSALSAPHPANRAAFTVQVGQIIRSSYIGAMMIPGLAELAMGPETLLATIESNLRRTVMTQEEREKYLRVVRVASTRRALISMYRALSWTSPRAHNLELARVNVPSLVIRGAKDPFLSKGVQIPPPSWASPETEIYTATGAGHWVHWDASVEVGQRYTEFLDRVSQVEEPQKSQS